MGIVTGVVPFVRAMGFGLLLPDPCALSWGQVHVLPELVTITMRTSSPVGRCPLCKRPSSRVHSWYRRTLADLPWHGDGCPSRTAHPPFLL
jgi:hypothetical protein